MILLAVSQTAVTLIIILAAFAGVMTGLYFLGKRAEKKQAEAQEQLDQHKQTVSILIIDKKRMRAKDSGLPDMIVSQIPWYGQWQKLPIVKAKVGPKIMSLVCDDKIFDDLPVKREVKASVSGIYITSFKGIRGKKNDAQPKKKTGFRGWVEKLQEKAGAKPVK